MPRMTRGDKRKQCCSLLLLSSPVNLHIWTCTFEFSLCSFRLILSLNFCVTSFTTMRKTCKCEKLIAHDKNGRIHVQVCLKLLLIYHLHFGLWVNDDSLSWSFPWNSDCTSKFFIQFSVQKGKTNGSCSHYLLGHVFGLLWVFFSDRNFLKQRLSEEKYWFLSFHYGKMECSFLRKQTHKNISKRIPQSHSVQWRNVQQFMQVTSLGQELPVLWSSLTNIPGFNLSRTELTSCCHQN